MFAFPFFKKRWWWWLLLWPAGFSEVCQVWRWCDHCFYHLSTSLITQHHVIYLFWRSFWEERLLLLFLSLFYMNFIQVVIWIGMRLSFLCGSDAEERIELLWRDIKREWKKYMTMMTGLMNGLFLQKTWSGGALIPPFNLSIKNHHIFKDEWIVS